MSALLIKLSCVLFWVSVIGALLGVVMAKAMAPTDVEQEQSDERSQRNGWRK
ncbi:hypothetical protein [Ralstonia sp. CP]|uniref:hypothetical protein n=1 Tax=Ralstonia sp. CP TaxID=3231757 RepID=UPI00345C60ED